MRADAVNPAPRGSSAAERGAKRAITADERAAAERPCNAALVRCVRHRRCSQLFSRRDRGLRRHRRRHRARLCHAIERVVRG